MPERTIQIGIIGGGLMGRELASAVARWSHLLELDFRPKISGVCDPKEKTLEWFSSMSPYLRVATKDYRYLLDDPGIDAIYCAIPHNQHEKVYKDILAAGKHLLGEKPFGLDQAANSAILAEITQHKELLVRCSSEFPFFPGAYQVAEMMRDELFGRIIEVEAGFWHSSDLDPGKPINWKRKLALNGEYGCLGDLGMHVVHLPFRAGWFPRSVSALFSKVIPERPDGKGGYAACETWDNAMLSCETELQDYRFPMTLSTKRIAPGHSNTWFIKIYGTELSAEFSTQYPKHLRLLPYKPGGAQEWRVIETPHRSAYKSITGAIFEFGFADAMLQMTAAYCDELVHGRGGMLQPFFCATPEETALGHHLFASALTSYAETRTIRLS